MQLGWRTGSIDVRHHRLRRLQWLAARVNELCAPRELLDTAPLFSGHRH